MRMRGKKAIFNYRDTWSLDSTLRPIIGAGINKFLEVGTNPKHAGWFGVPSSLVEGHSDSDFELSAERWERVLETMRYAFNEKQPDIMDYDFEYNFDSDLDRLTSLTLSEGTVGARDQYEQDSREWEAKCQEGYENFGRYFTSLWW